MTHSYINITRPISFNAEVFLPSKVKKRIASVNSDATVSTEPKYIDSVASDEVEAEFNRVLNNVNYKFLRWRKEAAEQSANARLKRVESLCALHTLFVNIPRTLQHTESRNQKRHLEQLLFTNHVLLIDWERWRAR